MVRGERLVKLRKNSVLTHRPCSCSSSDCSRVSFRFEVGFLEIAFFLARFAAAADMKSWEKQFVMHPAATLVVQASDKPVEIRNRFVPSFLS